MLTLFLKYGKSWSKIARSIPGRNENSVKNRWNSIVRKEILKDPNSKLTHFEVAMKLLDQQDFSNEEAYKQS